MKKFLLVLLIFPSNFIITYAQQWQFANGPYEATLYNISIDKQKPNILYTVGEGVFRSSNNGEYWTDIEPDTILGSHIEPVIKADPQTSGIVYYGGHGALFKSYDYGKTWEIIGFENRDVTCIEVDSSDANVIYVGLKQSSDDVLWKSVDGGITWVKKTNGIPVNQNPIQKCKAIRINPLNHTSIVAGVSFEGIFKTINGGNNWQLLIEDGNPIYEIEILPWDTAKIFFSDWTGVYKTTNSGTSWIKIFNGDVPSIEINQNNREIYIGTDGTGVYKSPNEGDTWINLNNPELPISFSLAMSVFDVRLDLNDDSILYISTGAGIYKSFDAGLSWQRSFDGLNKFYAYDIKIAHSNPAIIYTTGREGIHRSSDRGQNWRYIGGGAAENLIAIDPTNPDIVYIVQVTHLIEYYLWRTTDGGKTWEKKLTSPTTFKFVEFDPLNSNIIFTTIRNSSSESVLCKSTNRGDTWYSLNSPEPTSILISKYNSQIIYLGTKIGVYKTNDGGISWVNLGLSDYDSYIFLSFAEDESIIFASVADRGVFKTTDDGSNWEEKNNGLTSKSISVFLTNPKQLNQYYISTIDSGIYVTNDGANTWDMLKPKHPSLRIDAIFLDTVGTGRIFASGRDAPGIYILDLNLTNIEEQDLIGFPTNFVLYQNYPNPFNASTSIKFLVQLPGNIKLEIYDYLGRKIKTLINEYKNKGEYSIEWNGKNENDQDVSSGIYFSRILNSNISLSKKMILIK